MKSGRLVVRHNTAWQHRAFHVFLLLLVLGAGWGLYYIGQNQAGFSVFESKEVEAQLQEKINSLEQDKLDLRDKLALLKRASQVDGQAYEQIKLDIKPLQQEILELREEVSFYRGIVAPRESSAGMRVDKFNVVKTNGEGLYHFTLVLTQVIKNKRTTRGTAKMTVEGEQNGRPRKLTLKTIAVNKKKYLEFKFKYFQKIEGDLILPKGFTPRQVLVEVSPHKKKKIKSSFDWPNDAKEQVVEVPKIVNE